MLEKLHNLSKINLVFTISQLIAIESHVSYFIFLGISEIYTANDIGAYKAKDYSLNDPDD